MAARHIQQNIEGTSAMIAGIALLIMTVAAAFSYGYVHNSFIVSGSL